MKITSQNLAIQPQQYLKIPKKVKQSNNLENYFMKIIEALKKN